MHGNLLPFASGKEAAFPMVSNTALGLIVMLFLVVAHRVLVVGAAVAAVFDVLVTLVRSILVFHVVFFILVRLVVAAFIAMMMVVHITSTTVSLDFLLTSMLPRTFDIYIVLRHAHNQPHEQNQ